MKKNHAKIPIISLYVLFLFLFNASGMMAQDLSGDWAGQLSQEEGAPYQAYRYEMKLKQKGNQIEGYSYIYVNELFGKIKLKGTFDGKYLVFEEYEIVQQEIGKNFIWCLKKGTLTILEQKGYYYLQGLWEGHSSQGRCHPGKLWVSKAIPPKTTLPKPPLTKVQNDTTSKTPIKPIEKTNTAITQKITPALTPVKIKPGEAFQGRTVKEEQAALEVKSRELTIEIWDHKEIDGDIISLFHNGIPILENYTLKNSKYTLTIEIDPSEDNFLVLHAHNLGSIIPNTAAISVKDRNQNQVRILRSDLNQSEVIRLKYLGD